MDNTFISPESSERFDSHRLLLNFSGKIDFKRNDKYVALSSFSIYQTWNSIKKSYENNKLKLFRPTWNEKFELRDRPYSVSDIQYYYEYLIKKNETFTDNFGIRIYIDKIEN